MVEKGAASLEYAQSTGAGGSASMRASARRLRRSFAQAQRLASWAISTTPNTAEHRPRRNHSGVPTPRRAPWGREEALLELLLRARRSTTQTLRTHTINSKTTHGGHT